MGQHCPSYFRFVDFGLPDGAGGMTRGGPLFRAESLGGTSLLARDQTRCRGLRDIALDGHGNPIPVVTAITYRAEKTGLDLTALAAVLTPDSGLAASSAARRHRAQTGQEQLKGAASLCRYVPNTRQISCQLVSPYPGNVDLVVYCEATGCQMPVLAVHPQIAVSAAWQVEEAFWDSPEQAGQALLARVQAIAAFLKPLTSGL